MVSRAVFVLLILSLAACSQPRDIVLFPDAAEVGKIKTIFVSTTRKLDANGRPGIERAIDPSYFRYDISVPPLREDGQIRRPRGTVNPATDFVATRKDSIAQRSVFQADLARELGRQPRHLREVVIYVHGFYNNFSDGILRLAQLSNDFDFSGASVHYSWPSAGALLGYEYDRDSQLFGRDGLEALIETVRRAGAGKIVLVGHSMGSQLIMETLRQMAIASPGSPARHVDGVILISPDIDVNVFQSQAHRIGALPDPFIVFVSRRDRALYLSGLLTGQRDRVGNLRKVEDLSGLGVQLIDVTEFSTGLGHNAPSESPVLIQLLGKIGSIDAAFRNEDSGDTDLASVLVLTVRGATELILSPVTALTK